MTAGPRGSGEMAGRIRAHDWARTPLGDRAGWPQSLAGTVELMLAHGFPMCLLWGPDRIAIYNDGYRALMGDHHPAVLGRALYEVWPEVRGPNEPSIRLAWQGQTVSLKDVHLRHLKHRAQDEAWYDATYCAVRDEGGATVGVLATAFETTERMQGERELRASEQRYRAYVGASADVVYRMSADWSQMVQLDGQGIDVDLPMGREDWMQRYLLPEDRPQMQQAIDQAVHTRRLFELEHRVVRADGSVGWTLSRALPMLDANGDISQWLGAAKDVTAAKLTEQALQQSEERYRALFDSIDDGFCIIEVLFDEAGKPCDYVFLQTNPAFERQTGLHDAVGKRMRELAPGHEQHWFDVYGRIALTGEPVRFEDEAAALNRWFDVYAFRIGAPEQRRVAVLFRDILVRRRSEQALRESEARYRSLFESIDEGVTIIELVYDDRGRCVDFIYGESNPAQERLTGLHLRPGRRFSDIVPSIDPAWMALYARVAKTGTPERFERYAPHLDRWFDVYASRIGGDGSRQVVVVYNNITGRKRHEANLAFLADVTQDLAALTSIGATMQALGAKLGAHFKVSRCAFAELDEASDRAVVEFDWHQPHMPSLVGMYRVGDFFTEAFLRTLHDGQVFVMNDRSTDPRADVARLAALQVAAMIAVPFLRDGELLSTLCIYSDQPRAWTTGEATLLQELASRIWTRLERARAERGLYESELRQRVLIEGMPQLVWRAAADGQWTWTSPQWSQYSGQSSEQSQGWGWLDAVHPDDRQAVQQAWQRAGDSGKVELDYRVCHIGERRYRWFHTRASAVRDETNAIVEWLGTTTDVDEARALQERQTVLVAELQHRTRNLMGVIRSIADKTRRASTDLPDFMGRYGDRLDALARVQGLLSRMQDHDRVTFDELITTELNAMAGNADRARLDGPKGVRLRSSTVQALALAVHELATNAIKYGALGQPDAQLVVRWWLQPDGPGARPWLHIDWRESGVAMPPPASGNTRGGQGRELIERALPYQFEAQTRFALGADGVHCTISLPVSATT